VVQGDILETIPERFEIPLADLMQQRGPSPAKALWAFRVYDNQTRWLCESMGSSQSMGVIGPEAILDREVDPAKPLARARLGHVDRLDHDTALACLLRAIHESIRRSHRLLE
jgi:hypothetical protein